MTNPIRLTRKEVREEFKQFLIFKWYCPEFVDKSFLNHLMDQLTFEDDVIEFPTLAEMTFCFNSLIDEGIQWQRKEWEKEARGEQETPKPTTLTVEMLDFFR